MDRSTKAGNAHLRRVLVEAAWAYRYRPAFKGRLAALKKGHPQWVVDISFRAQERLNLRYRSLTRRGKLPQVAVTAIARELLRCRRGPQPHPATYPSATRGPARLPIHRFTIGRFISASLFEPGRVARALRLPWSDSGRRQYREAKSLRRT